MWAVYRYGLHVVGCRGTSADILEANVEVPQYPGARSPLPISAGIWAALVLVPGTFAHRAFHLQPHRTANRDHPKVLGSEALVVYPFMPMTLLRPGWLQVSPSLLSALGACFRPNDASATAYRPSPTRTTDVRETWEATGESSRSMSVHRNGLLQVCVSVTNEAGDRWACHYRNTLPLP